MGASFGRSKFIAIPDDFERQEKAYIGEYGKINLADSKEMFLSFDFVDMSMQELRFCYNGTDIDVFDYKSIFLFLKELSGKTIDDIFISGKLNKYDIKMMNLNPKRNRLFIENLCRVLKVNTIPKDMFQLPPVYQARLYNSGHSTSLEKEKAPRVYFVLGLQGCLSMILLDLYHEFFPAENRSS